MTGLGKWLEENAPDAESALAAIEKGAAGPSWRGEEPSWENQVDFGYRDGRWWSWLDNGIGLTNYASEVRIPLRLQLALGDEANHATWERLIVSLDDDLGGEQPQEAPPAVDVDAALVAMHDENDRLSGLLHEARELLWQCANLSGIAQQARTLADKINDDATKEG